MKGHISLALASFEEEKKCLPLHEPQTLEGACFAHAKIDNVIGILDINT